MEKTIRISDLDHYLDLTDNDIFTLSYLKRAKDPKHPGNFDALSILERKYRFKAIAASPARSR